MRKFLRKPLLFKTQKVDSTGYYGIEDPFPDLISKLRRFRGVPIVVVKHKAVGTAEAGEVSASPLFCRSGRGFVCASAYYHVAF